MGKTSVKEKYGKTYFMPPQVTYDWVQKDSIEKAPIWCSVDLRGGNVLMTEQFTNGIKVSSERQHHCGECVSRRMECNRLVYACTLRPRLQYYGVIVNGRQIIKDYF